MSNEIPPSPDQFKDRVKLETKLLEMIGTIHGARVAGNIPAYVDAIEGMIDSLEGKIVDEIERDFVVYQNEINRQVGEINGRITEARSSAEKLVLVEKRKALTEGTRARHRFLVAKEAMYKHGLLIRPSDEIIRLENPEEIKVEQASEE